MRFCCVPYFLRSAMLVFIAVLTLVAQTPVTGVHPRNSSRDYAVSQQTPTATFAASLVPPDQVRRLFIVDISKTYLVFEVACYPSKAGTGGQPAGQPSGAGSTPMTNRQASARTLPGVSLEENEQSVILNPVDFLIKSPSHSEFEHPTDAATIAAFIQEKTAPPRIPGRGPAVSTTAEVGYESGTDPYTGRRVHDVYTAGGVRVDTAPDRYPDPPQRRGSSPQDRAALENQLADKALPQGEFRAPVAGFLYFAAEPLKKAKDTFDLQYVNDTSGKVELLVPSKVK